MSSRSADAERSHPPVRGVVFDLDGTLIESRPAIAASVNHALVSLGHPPRPVAELAGYIGWGLERLLGRLFGPDDLDQARRLYSEHYRRTCVEASQLLPGVGETLSVLVERGLRLGVATNKASEAARQVLAGLGIERWFTTVIGADQVTELKPRPEPLERAIADLGLTKAEVVYVGDMHIDVETAAAAGVRFIAVATGCEGRDDLLGAGASTVVDGLAELVERVTAAAGPGRDRYATLS